MRRFAAYEPESVLCLTGPGDGPSQWHVVIEGLREIAAAAQEAGVRLGIEPCHPAQRETVSFVNTISDACQLLEVANLPEVGIMADTYNLWHETPDALAAIADRVTGLHVADVPLEAERTDRALPGEAGRRSASFLRALVEAGWEGFVDVEIFSTPERFWKLPVADAAHRAFAAASSLVQTLPRSTLEC
jgi:sugar phosphate isomerase/epimerase